MKKILAFVLAAVMVLGLVATAVSAAGNPAYDGYSVSMGEDISLNVYFKDLDPTVTYTAKVNGEAAKLTVDGTAGVVKIAELTPVMIGTEYTVELYNGEEKVAETDKAKSVLGYCEWALTNMSLSNDVHTLVVNLLNYAAAIQAYENVENTATSWLNDLQKALAITGTAPVNPYAATDDETGKAIVWDGATIVLGESIAYRFFFKAETMPEDVKFVATLGGVETPVGAYVNDAVKGYYVDFTALTPADLFKDVVIKAVGADGAEYSVAKTFSAERYASYAAAGENDAVKNAMSAILNYSKAAEAYNAVALSNPNHEFAKQPKRDIKTGALTAHERYRISDIEESDYTSSGIQLTNLLPWLTSKIGVNITTHSDYTSLSYSKALSAINNSKNAGHIFYNQMLLGAATSGVGLGIAEEDLMIGDVFVGWWEAFRDKDKKAYTNYYGAVWLGEDKGFLVVHDNYSKKFDTDGVTVIGATNNKVIDVVKYDVLNQVNFVGARYVLCMSQLAERDITDGPLSDVEKRVMSKLTIKDINIGSSAHLYAVMPSVYANAGINLQAYDKKANDVFGILFALNKGTGFYEPMAPSTAEANKHYQGMLTDYYGGSLFAESVVLAEENLKIGDIFIGRIQYAKNSYFAGVYQGNGKFLMVYGDANSAWTNGVLDISDLNNPAKYDFKFYAVLRPSQLANQAG